MVRTAALLGGVALSSLAMEHCLGFVLVGPSALLERSSMAHRRSDGTGGGPLRQQAPVPTQSRNYCGCGGQRGGGGRVSLMAKPPKFTSSSSSPNKGPSSGKRRGNRKSAQGDLPPMEDGYIKVGPEEDEAGPSGGGGGKAEEDPWKGLGRRRQGGGRMGTEVNIQLRRDDTARDMFQTLMGELLNAEKMEELPGIITKDGIHEALLTFDLDHFSSNLIDAEPTAEGREVMRNAFTFVVDFLEEFVDMTSLVEKRNQQTLRKIIDTAREAGSSAALDEVLIELKDSLDFEFVQYLEAEVEQLKRNGGTEMSGVLSIIRSRVCEEIDKSVGFEAAALGKVLGFQDREMSKAAIKASLENRSEAEVDLFVQLTNATLRDALDRGDAVDPELPRKLGYVLEDCEALGFRLSPADAQIKSIPPPGPPTEEEEE